VFGVMGILILFIMDFLHIIK